MRRHEKWAMSSRKFDNLRAFPASLGHGTLLLGRDTVVVLADDVRLGHHELGSPERDRRDEARGAVVAQKLDRCVAVAVVGHVGGVKGLLGGMQAKGRDAGFWLPQMSAKKNARLQEVRRRDLP